MDHYQDYLRENAVISVEEEIRIRIMDIVD
jgi:hypothetical protein